ncbi:MAG: carboxypeptidase regulatory-like domain-containing protein [Bryobacteraceae bacterium]
MLLILASVLLFSQGSEGRISGTVTDQSGAAIAGAKVIVTDEQRNVPRTLTTDSSGSYSAPNLLPSTYDVHVEFQGFKSSDRRDLVLDVAQDLRVDVSLQTGEQSETVVVTAEAAALNTTNAELGGTLENKVINDLPLNGRNFENLLDLRPGVVKYPGNAGWTQATNGLRPHDNFFMVDGIDANDPWMAQSMMNAVMAAGDAGTMLPIDAINEFQTQQNPRAEYGWKPGAVVNVGVKSGSNEFHGTAYAYGRTSSWDANNFFSNEVGQPLPPLALEQYGASIGGPIIRDRLFFFGNFESQQYNVGSPFVHSVPFTAPGSGTATNSLVGACQSALAGGNLSALSAQLAGLSSTCAPLSNYPGLFPSSSTGTYATALGSSNSIFSGVGRLDYRINDKNTLNGLFFMSPGSGTFVDDAIHEIAPEWVTTQYARSQVISGNWVYVATPTVVNSLRIGISRYHQIFGTPDVGENPADYSYNGSTYHFYTGQTDPTFGGFPRIQINGFPSFQLGGPVSWPKTVGPDSVYQFNDGISMQRGKHAIKFGGEVLLNRSDDNVTSNNKGPVAFRSLDDFFTGTLKSAHITSGDTARSLSDEGYALFIQDDWRLTSRITVNLGLRYELTTVVQANQDLIGNFLPGQGIFQAGSTQLPNVMNGDHKDFAPRVGFAWDMFGNGRTVLRGGAGVYYSQASFDAFMAVANLYGLRTIPTGVPLYTNGNSTPTTAGGKINVASITYSGSSLGSATTPGSIAYGWANNSSTTPLYSLNSACGDGTVTLSTGFTPQPCSILGVDPNLKTPYVATFNLGIQHALTRSLSLEATYVGNDAQRLFGVTDLNQPQQVGGFSAGWGNPANPNSPAGQCLASASSGYNNCAPNGAAEVAAQPYNSKFPYLNFIDYLQNNNVSNYNALQVSLTQRQSHGLSFVLGYTYSHALAENYDNWSYVVPINSDSQKSIYGDSMFDIRHHFTASVTYLLPGKKTKSQLLDGWSINSIMLFQSGAPWAINDLTTDFSGTNEINNPIGSNGEQWDFFGNPSDFQDRKSFNDTNGCSNGTCTTGIPYYPGTSNAACLAQATAMGQLAVASLTNLGCYANGKSILIPPPYGSYGTTGNNIFRGIPYYNVDMSITKAFRFKERVTAQFRAEFFNIFNHANIANPEGGPGGFESGVTDPSGTGGAGFGFLPSTPDVVSSNAVLGSGGPRAIQLGLKLIF